MPSPADKTLSTAHNNPWTISIINCVMGNPITSGRNSAHSWNGSKTLTNAARSDSTRAAHVPVFAFSIGSVVSMGQSQLEDCSNCVRRINRFARSIGALDVFADSMLTEHRHTKPRLIERVHLGRDRRHIHSRASSSLGGTKPAPAKYSTSNATSFCISMTRTTMVL